MRRIILLCVIYLIANSAFGANLYISPNTLSFGDCQLNTTVSLNVEMGNRGNAAINIVACTYRGPNAADFAPVLPTFAFPATTSFTLPLQFHPTQKTTETAQLLVTTDEPGNTTVTVNLKGAGVSPVVRIDTPGPIDFGTVAPGGTADRSVTITNTSDTMLTFSGFQYAAGTLSAAPAEVQTLPAGSTTVSPGQSRTYTLRFAPTHKSVRRGYATLSSNAAKIEGATSITVAMRAANLPYETALDWSKLSENQTGPGGIGRAMVYFNGKLWLPPYGTGTTQMYSSPDGVAWTLSATNFTPHPYFSLVAYAGKLWAVGGATPYGSAVYSSTDGLTWTTVTTTGAFGPARQPRLAVYNGKLWAISNGVFGTGRVCTTTDGANWTQLTSLPNLFNAHGAVPMNGKLLVGGWNQNAQIAPGVYPGYVYSTLDGLTWTTHSTTYPSGHYLKGDMLGFNNTLYAFFSGITIASLATSGAWKSTDGITWVEAAESTIPSLNAELLLATDPGAIYMQNDPNFFSNTLPTTLWKTVIGLNRAAGWTRYR